MDRIGCDVDERAETSVNGDFGFDEKFVESPHEANHDDPLIVDWDALDAERFTIFP